MSPSDVVALLAAFGAILGTFAGLYTAGRKEHHDRAATMFQDALELADRYKKEAEALRVENRALLAELAEHRTARYHLEIELARLGGAHG